MTIVFTDTAMPGPFAPTLVVVTEFRFHMTADQTIRADVQNRGYPFWERYLSAFPTVLVLGRVAYRPSAGGSPAEGAGVAVAPIGDYRGLVGFLLNFVRVRREIRDAVKRADALVIRAPSPLGSLAFRTASRRNIPIAIEVVGDPAEVVGTSTNRVLRPFRPVLRRLAQSQLQRQVAAAAGVSYVTESQLQNRYPPARESFTTSYSSLQLDDTAFAAAPRSEDSFSRTPVGVICVARFAQRYKGHHVLIDALSRCRSEGLDVRLCIVGDGVHREVAEQQASALGVSGSVTFVGEIADLSRIHQFLDAADLFVLPSLTEGLPRVVIEAMARALPCIATDVGGVYELLDADRRVPPGDSHALALAIQSLASDRKALAADSAKNWERAQKYRASELSERRSWFYSQLRDLVPQPTALHD